MEGSRKFVPWKCGTREFYPCILPGLTIYCSPAACPVCQSIPSPSGTRSPEDGKSTIQMLSPGKLHKKKPQERCAGRNSRDCKCSAPKARQETKIIPHCRRPARSAAERAEKSRRVRAISHPQNLANDKKCEGTLYSVFLRRAKQ